MDMTTVVHMMDSPAVAVGYELFSISDLQAAAVRVATIDKDKMRGPAMG